MDLPAGSVEEIWWENELELKLERHHPLLVARKKQGNEQRGRVKTLSGQRQDLKPL